MTVERKEGQFTLPDGRKATLLDLPGVYSLNALGPDEVITHDICYGLRADVKAPDLIVCVVDATNLRLHLRFALELKALGRPLIVALNMMDEARIQGLEINRSELETRLGVPVVETVAVKSEGIDALKSALGAMVIKPISASLVPTGIHALVREILKASVSATKSADGHINKIDSIVLNPITGSLILVVLMFVMFQAVYSWATPLADLIEAGLNAAGAVVTQSMPDGIFKDFLLTCIFAGLGSVLVFLPQILILFAFILVLEESGYLPRAAYLLDALMSKVGLTGRAFVPLLSSFACAVPGIMATRSIQDPRDRLTTILIAPLMTCSARLPIYTLLIGAFIPDQSVWGGVNLRGLVLFVLYFSGMAAAFLVAGLIRFIRKDRSEAPLMLEIPPYRWPQPMALLRGLYERAVIFIQRITGIILVVNTLLWVLISFPKPPKDAVLPAIDYSFAGQIGHALEGVFAPIGFNWQIIVALIPGMAAREVAVSALGTVYAVSGEAQLGQALSHSWSLATALSLLAWYVFAPQCISTLAVIKRETNGWTYVWISAAYLFGLAYVASFFTYQIAVRLL